MDLGAFEKDRLLELILLWLRNDRRSLNRDPHESWFLNARNFRENREPNHEKLSRREEPLDLPKWETGFPTCSRNRWQHHLKWQKGIKINQNTAKIHYVLLYYSVWRSKSSNNTFRIIYQQSNIVMDVNIGMYFVMG